VTARAWEPLFRNKASELFNKEKDELAAILRKEGKASLLGEPYLKFLDEAVAYLLVSKDGWRQEFLPLFAGLLGAQAENVLAAYGIAWDIQRPDVQEWIYGYAETFAEKVAGTTIEGFRDLIGTAQAEGWPVTQTREQIIKTWDGWAKGKEDRANMIARTETMRSSNYGTKQAWADAGVTTVKWHTHKDDRTCDWCLEMDGTTIGIAESYWNLGDTFDVTDAEGNVKTMNITYSGVECPPLHVYCRCVETAVIE